MSKFKIVLGYLMGFFSSICLVAIVLLVMTKTTILSKDYVREVLKNNDYYEKIYSEINEEMELHLLSTGFNKDILKDIYTKEEVNLDIDTFIDNTYNGNVTVLDKSEIRYKLKMNIDNYIKETNLTIMNKDDLTKFVNDIVDIYKNEICLYEYTDSVIPMIPKVIKLVNIALIALSVILVIMIVVLLIVIKNRLFSSIIVSSGLIILFVRLFIFERIDADNILIITEDFSKILRLLMNNFKNNTFLYAVILIFIGILFLICEAMCKPKKKKPIKD